ncbi:hypothetical protein MAR_024327, partial [Mya arenaria]
MNRRNRFLRDRVVSKISRIVIGRPFRDSGKSTPIDNNVKYGRDTNSVYFTSEHLSLANPSVEEDEVLRDGFTVSIESSGRLSDVDVRVLDVSLKGNVSTYGNEDDHSSEGSVDDIIDQPDGDEDNASLTSMTQAEILPTTSLS